MSPASGPRLVAYAHESILDESGDYVVAMITEDEAGYSPSTYTGTLEYCQSVATTINERRGLCAEDVLDVVASSIAAQRHHHGTDQDTDQDTGREDIEV